MRHFVMRFEILKCVAPTDGRTEGQTDVKLEIVFRLTIVSPFSNHPIMYGGWQLPLRDDFSCKDSISFDRASIDNAP